MFDNVEKDRFESEWGNVIKKERDGKRQVEEKECVYVCVKKIPASFVQGFVTIDSLELQ